jgi:nitrate reductase NapE component
MQNLYLAFSLIAVTAVSMLVGTGYSVWSQIIKLPVYFLKI